MNLTLLEDTLKLRDLRSCKVHIEDSLQDFVEEERDSELIWLHDPCALPKCTEAFFLVYPLSRITDSRIGQLSWFRIHL